MRLFDYEEIKKTCKELGVPEDRIAGVSLWVRQSGICLFLAGMLVGIFLLGLISIAASI